MDKIDIKLWEDAEVKTQTMRCMVGINKLIDGYNELKTQIMVMKSSFNVDIDDKILKGLNASKGENDE